MNSEMTLPGAERVVAGRYHLSAELRRGGMGVVWLADDTLIGRQVAIKELRAPGDLSSADRELFRQRALTEARNAARVRHPGAVTLHDVIPATGGDDAVYLVMELIQAPTLADMIASSGPLRADQAARIGLQLLDVLDVAHALGVVHRDVKPANIMIEGGNGGEAGTGRVWLADFGIAHSIADSRLTRSGVMGTQAYLAPELFDGAPIAAAADLWSLGATLYHATSGTGPFDRGSTAATLRAILFDDVPAPACPPPLATAITALLTRDPARRAASHQARPLLQQAAAMPAAHVAAQPTTPPQPAPAPYPGHFPATITAPTASLARPAPASPGIPRAAWELQPTIHSARPGRAPQAHVASGRRARWKNPWLIGAAAVVLMAALVAVPLWLNSGQPAGHRPSRLAAMFTDPKSPGLSGVAFSPDGTTVATADDADCTYLWNTRTGKLAAKLTEPGSSPAINGFAFSPDGSTLATADASGSTYLWNLATSKVAVTLTNPYVPSIFEFPSAEDVAFMSRTTLAEADSNGSVDVWDTATRAITATLSEPNREKDLTEDQTAAVFLAFSPRGQALAGAASDGTTYLWDVSGLG